MASTGIIFIENWSYASKAEMGGNVDTHTPCDLISLLFKYVYIVFHEAQQLQRFCQPFTIFWKKEFNFFSWSISLSLCVCVCVCGGGGYSIAAVTSQVPKYWCVLCNDIDGNAVLID
jgi:hypothetical protein